MAARADRRHAAAGAVPAGDERSPFERDRDRILYATNFRRLGRVTQVAGPGERHLTHNRLTHSLEVSQIGRGLATRLRTDVASQEMIAAAGGLDAAVVEAAALAHDLGHPPFGHVAESELNALLTAAGVADGFEGNAQSFRIVTTLGVHYPDLPGLDLTRATLCAILKYPWMRDGSRERPASGAPTPAKRPISAGRGRCCRQRTASPASRRS